jgi:hypothetical protein
LLSELVAEIQGLNARPGAPFGSYRRCVGRSEGNCGSPGYAPNDTAGVDDRFRSVSKPFRAGLTFGGRPSGPCTCTDLLPCHFSLNLPQASGLLPRHAGAGGVTKENAAVPCTEDTDRKHWATASATISIWEVEPTRPFIPPASGDRRARPACSPVARFSSGPLLGQSWGRPRP